MSNTKIESQDWDVRVRERNLKYAKITDKDVAKFITDLPDLADQAEPVTVAQPAIGGRED